MVISVRDNRQVELRHLEYFVAVAEELSFTRASRRLHVVQSGVSSAIQSLERDLGTPLFERDRHRVAMTDAGQALLPEARATLAAAQAARDVVGQARGGLRGTVTVGTMQSTGALDLPGRLGRLMRCDRRACSTLILKLSARSNSNSIRSASNWSADRMCRDRVSVCGILPLLTYLYKYICKSAIPLEVIGKCQRFFHRPLVIVVYPPA